MTTATTVAVAAAMATSPPAPRRRVVLVTGATDGIGQTTAKNLAAQGYHVLLHGRDADRLQATVDRVHQFVADQAATLAQQVVALPPANLASRVECRQLADRVVETCRQRNWQLHVLLNNAGVYSEDYCVSEDGLELTFAVNVLAPFVLTSRLLPLLCPDDGRIVIASSLSQCRNIRNWDTVATGSTKERYSAHGAYSESKLLDAMLTMELSERLQSSGGPLARGVTCNCLDPGTVNTKMLLAGWGPCGIDVEDALDETWLCSSEEGGQVTGKYFVWKSAQRASASAYDASERSKMWKLLQELAPEEANMWEQLGELGS